MKYFGNLITFLVLVTVAVSQEYKPYKAIAVLSGNGPVKGNVTFTQNRCGEPVFVEYSINGLTPGKHGFHVHEKGDLSNGCLSTLGHYNPDKLDHGAPHAEIRHVGDLGNVEADGTGAAHSSFSDHYLTLSGPRSIIGRGIVVHETVDDLGLGGHPDSKKTGNAGGRVACGVIGIFSPEDSEWKVCGAGHRLYMPVFLVTLLAFTALYFR